MATITLENMKFHAYHGCLQHEKTFGNTFLITIEMHLNTDVPEITDDLSDTLNYQLVYDAIKNEMEQPSELLEHIARRIVNRIHRDFPQITGGLLSISKTNPPLGGSISAVRIQCAL